jgi:hypothetical protein
MPMTTTEQPATYSIRETCDKIDRSRWTVHRLINDNVLKASKRGAARNAEVRVTVESVNTYLAGRPVEPSETSQASA